MGGGFALGTQEVQYFVRFGSSAFYFPIITMGILATVFYFAWEFQRLYHVTDYVSFFRTLFAPAGSLFMTLYDIAFLITVVLAAGATLAGFGNALAGALGGINVSRFPCGLATLLVLLLCTFLYSSGYLRLPPIFPAFHPRMYLRLRSSRVPFGLCWPMQVSRCVLSAPMLMGALS